MRRRRKGAADGRHKGFSVYVALTNIPVGELLTGFAMRSDPNVVFDFQEENVRTWQELGISLVFDFYRSEYVVCSPERRPIDPIDSRGSGKKWVLATALATCFCPSLQLVPKRIIVRDQIPRPKYPGTRWVEMACLQEWDADRRQAAHAEKSLAVRELVRLSLRAKSTGVVAELHLDTALVAPSGSGADHERQIRGDARQQIGVAS